MEVVHDCTRLTRSPWRPNVPQGGGELLNSLVALSPLNRAMTPTAPPLLRSGHDIHGSAVRSTLLRGRQSSSQVQTRSRRRVAPSTMRSTHPERRQTSTPSSPKTGSVSIRATSSTVGNRVQRRFRNSPAPAKLRACSNVFEASSSETVAVRSRCSYLRRANLGVGRPYAYPSLRRSRDGREGSGGHRPRTKQL